MVSSVATVFITVAPAADCPLPENCGCDCGYPAETAADLISQIAIAMGYSSQLERLPASFVTQALFHLNLAQNLVVTDISEIANDRYFSWDVEPGQFMFCPTEVREECKNILVAARISEVYIVRNCTEITRLEKGIPFKLKDGGNPRSLPTRYEVRSCIEIWPKPDEPLRLVAKGTLAATKITAPESTIMVNPTALVLRAIAWMKASKQHADANNYMGQYQNLLGDMAADTHQDVRYIPGTDRLYDSDRLVHAMERKIYLGDND